MRVAASAACFFLLLGANASAAPCEALAPWLQVRAAARLGATVEVRVNAALDEPAALVKAARAWYRSYRAGELSKGLRKACVPKEAHREFELSFPSVFLDETIGELRNVPSAPVLASLLAKWDVLRRNGPVFPFHFSLESVGELRGGFDRGRKSLFLNYDDVSPPEWPLLLVHEIAHAVDPILARAVVEFQRPSNVERVTELTLSTSTYEDLPPADREFLLAWLRSGLDRGLLGEVRAWDVTKRVYEEGRYTGAFAKIDWLESLGFDARSETDSRAALLADFSPRFPDPNEGVFTAPLVQNALAFLRERLLATSSPTPDLLQSE